MNRNDEIKLIGASIQLKELGLNNAAVNIMEHDLRMLFKRFELNNVEEIRATKIYDIYKGGNVYSMLVFAIDDNGNKVIYDKSHVIYS